jgi:hypothetical protein
MDGMVGEVFSEWADVVERQRQERGMDMKRLGRGT